MKNNINLFPESLVLKNKLKHLLFYWVGCFALFFAALLVWSNMQSNKVKASSDYLHSLEKRIQPVNYIKRKTGRLEKKLASLSQGDSKQQRHSLRVLVAKIIGNVQLANQNLSVEKIWLDGTSRVEKTVRIKGIATSRRAVAQLVTRLESENMFLKVDINSESNFQIDGIAAKKYEVICTF